ncbi:MAG: DUF4125 family protein [Deltaproteobacteria bacterium]|nr:DUF4125 family protein [Deltaproteobacteria bacterium]
MEKLVKVQELVAAILDLEWEMFQRVRTAYPVSCQKSPETFRKIRASIFELWTEEMLASYLNDLRQAKAVGRNLLSEKYARMDNLIPRTNFNPLIDKIVALDGDWQAEVKDKYPHLYSRVCRGMEPTNDGNNFNVYLRCELETYGQNTIELYHQQSSKALADGENLTLSMLKRLVEKGGFKDLDQAERHLTGLQAKSPSGAARTN